MQRCYNPKYKHFAQYGGRGIAVHQPWHDVTVFASEMGDPPPDAPELDRIDNDKGYEPGNVRWATRLQQMRNQRRTIMVAFRGETRPLREWAEITKIPFDTLYQRLFKMKWDAERALSQPLGPTSVRYK